MASGYHGVIAGEKPPAATINDFWSKQAVMAFTAAADRTTQLSGVLREGMVSYLNDVNGLDMYDGTAWMSIPLGRRASASTTSAQNTVSTAVDLTGLSVTFTAVSSHYYRTTLYLPILLQNTSTGIIQGVITDATPTILQEARLTVPAGSNVYINCQLLETGVSGSVTRKGRLATSAGTVNSAPSATSPAFILVEDIGR